MFGLRQRCSLRIKSPISRQMSQPVCSSVHPEPGSRQSEIIPTTTGVGMGTIQSIKEKKEEIRNTRPQQQQENIEE